MASSDDEGNFSEANSSGLCCIHCSGDEVKWKCDDCFLEFCDKCKRMHLITDEETRNHHLHRYGSKRSSGARLPDVIHHSTQSVNEVQRPRVKFKPIIKSNVIEFKPKTTMVENSTVQHIRIVPRGNGEAWVKCGAISEELVLHDKDGDCVKRVKVDGVIHDFAITTNKEIIFTKIQSKTIWLYTKRGEIKPVLQLEFLPSCLYLTKENDLLICAASTLQSHGSPILKLSRTSQKSIVPIDQSVHLGDIYSVAQSANGTICLVEKGGWGPGRVIGIDQEGRQVFEYKGRSGSFNPSGITCDDFGVIYISDCSCHNVHVINETGQLQSFLLPVDTIQLPEAIDVSEDGILWLGNGNGEIKVYELKNELLDD